MDKTDNVFKSPDNSVGYNCKRASLEWRTAKTRRDSEVLGNLVSLAGENLQG